MSVLQTILGGAVGSSIVVGLFGLITWWLNRKAAKEDRQADREEKNEKEADLEMDKINKTLDNLTIAMRMLMYDRIKHLGNTYLDRGSISSEELADLLAMHKVYHEALNGNGFLDTVMDKVKAMPVKN